LLIASGIKEIKYIDDYKNDELVLYFLNQKGIGIEKI
jgi:deoxycytidylate deaminase